MALTLKDIQPNVPVQHMRRPELIGLLTGNHEMELALMAEVQWAGEKRFEIAGVLEKFAVDEDDSFEALVKKSRYERIEVLRRLMTFEKLNGALSNVIYSMQTADLDFYPHQFVPVLKFVNSPLNRLLIADEVGLGKTIESGLIWTECRARFDARRLLVVCKPTLIPKWIRELQDRFDIDAQEADARELLRRFGRFKAGARDGLSFALVTSYHALRPNQMEKEQLRPWLAAVGDGFRQVDGDPIDSWAPRPSLFRQIVEWDGDPFLDLAVFDEAHSMKNTATASHLVGRLLAPTSGALLALTATPLTVSTRDLFALLNLVDPDMFQDEAAFDAMRKRSLPAVKLARQLENAGDRIDWEECRKTLARIPDSTAKENLDVHLKELAGKPTPSAQDVVRARATAMRLNELGTFLTRTRKVELAEETAQRRARTLEVKPTPEELFVYNGVLQLIRDYVLSKGQDLSVFHLISPALSMTSCIPVVVEKLREGTFKFGDIDDLVNVEAAFYEGTGWSAFVGEDPEALQVDGLALPDHDFEATDTKYNHLKNLLMMRGDKDLSVDEKVIIFAFYKGTLRYLKRRLEADGIKCLLVTGDIKDITERDRLLRSFEDDEFRVLLCSEVAAEGVDLQFCRVMVNYDLPWNPMRVEQRIGRIDRIGQRADSIVVVNFHVLGTIDGSIYQHLYSNVELFQATVGSLRSILGDRVNALTKDLVTAPLDADERDEKVKDFAQALAIERQNMEAINEEADSLLGLRSYLQSSVAEHDSLGRYIKPSELRIYTERFFKDTFTGQDSCHLNWDTPAEGCLHIEMSWTAFERFKEYLEREQIGLPGGFQPGTRAAIVTFDPAVHEQLKRRNRKLVLANHLHPFVRWMTSTYRSNNTQWHPASAIRLDSGEFPEGTFFYMVQRACAEHSVLAREELLFRAVDAASLCVLGTQESESLVNAATERGSSWPPPSSGFPDMSDALGVATKKLAEDCAAFQRGFEEDLELRLNSKRAQIESHFARRIATAEKRIETMSDSPHPNREMIRVAQRQIQNLEAKLADERTKLNSEAATESHAKRVACGIIVLGRRGA